MSMSANQLESKPQRRVSFTSANIIAGCMPEQVGLDNPTINIIFTFDDVPKLDDVVAAVKTLFKYHRLASVPKFDSANGNWEFKSVGEIDPSRMVRELNITCDTSEEWTDTVQQQKHESLRREDLPWWEFVLMTNEGKGDHLLLFRIDHGIADGISLAHVFPCVLKRADMSEVSSLIPTNMISNKTNAEKNMLMMLLKLPKAIYDVGTSPLGKYDDPNMFSKNVVGNSVVDNRNRKLILFEPIPLNFVKEIKDKAGVSLNDVLLAAWSHAIYEYCHLQECQVIKANQKSILFRALMTYGFPHKKSSDPSDVIQNAWVPLCLKLPIGLECVSKKLEYIHKLTTTLKSSPVNCVLRWMPHWLSRQVAYAVYKKRSLTFTNVPGPQEQIMIAGKLVKSCSFFVNHLHPVLSILSYHGHLNITLSVDENAIPDAHLLPSCFMKALTLLSNNLNIDTPSSILQSSKLVD